MSTFWKCPCCGLGNESTKSVCIACFANKDSKQESLSQSLSESNTQQTNDDYSPSCIHINYLKKNIAYFKIINCAKCIAIKDDERLVFCLTCYQIYCARDSEIHHKENNHALCITLPTLKEYLKFPKDTILEMLTIYCYQCGLYLEQINPYNISKVNKIKCDIYQCLSASYEKVMCWDDYNDPNQNENNSMTTKQGQSNDIKLITISIRSQRGIIMQCEIKVNDTMKSIKSKIFEQHGILPQHQRFMYQGEYVTDTDTPSMLGIEQTVTLWLEQQTFGQDEEEEEEYFNHDVDDNVFISHMSMEEANALCVGDKFDHRDNVGKVFPAKVAMKLGSRVCVNYEGWQEKYNVWNDYQQQLWRFSKYESISRRPRHRFEELNVGDYIDINPIYSDYKGWKYAEITQIGQHSGQCQVLFESGNGSNRKVYWVHLDNSEEVAPFTTKANGNIGQQSQVINDIATVDQKQNIDDKKERYERNDSNDDIENKEMMEEQRKNLFVCQECDRSFRNEIDLNSHVTAMHSNISDTEKTEKTTKKKKRKKRKKKKKHKKKKDGNKNKKDVVNNAQKQQRQKHVTENNNTLNMDGKSSMTIDTEDSWECRTDETDQEHTDVTKEDVTFTMNDWKECPGAKGQIIKKILSESHWIGTGHDIDDDTKVTASYKIYYGDSNGREVILAEKQKLNIMVDDDDRFTNAFHIALKSMKRREKAVFKILDNTLINVDDIYIDDDELKINKLNNNKRISPKDKDTFYEIFIHDSVKEKEIGVVYTDNDCIQHGFKYKNDGNVLFQSGRYLGAIKKYQKALDWSDVQCKEDILLKKQKEELVISVNNNLAICKIKMKQWSDATYYASKVLDKEPNNLKALLRRAQSRLENGNLELSKKDLEVAHSLDNNNIYLSKLWEAWNIKYNKYVEKQQKINNLNDTNDLDKLHLLQRDYNELLLKQQSNEMIIEKMEGRQNELRSKLSEQHKRHCIEMESMKNVNNKLRFDNIELNRVKKELSSKYESTLLKLYNLEKKYNEQQKQWGYKAWDNKDVTNWIINLDKTRYNKYYNVLIQNIMNEGIDGGCLSDLDKNDLHRLGITKFKHKRDILKSIQDLIRNDNNTKGQDQISKECVVCMDNPCCYSLIPCGHLCLCHICKDLIKKSCPVCQKNLHHSLKYIFKFKLFYQFTVFTINCLLLSFTFCTVGFSKTFKKGRVFSSARIQIVTI